MKIIQDISEKYFNLNGINYAKIYQPLKQGSDSIGIYNVNDSRQQLVNSINFSEFEIDGNTYLTQAETIAALLDVVYASKLSGSAAVLIENKTDKGGYSGTTQDLKNELDTKIFEGAKTYENLAALQAVDPVPSNGTPAKVTNDSNSVNNGGYFVLAGVWTKEGGIYEDVVEESNVTKGVNGKAVAPIRDFRNFKFSSRSPFSFVNGVFSNTGAIYVFNNKVSGYIRIDNFSQDLSGLAVGSDGWYTYYLKASNIRNFLRGDSGSWVFDNASILSKKWSDANIDDLKANDVLVLFHYNSMQQTIDSPFLREYLGKKLFEVEGDVVAIEDVKNVRREMQFQIFNQNTSSGNVSISFNNDGDAIIVMTGDLLLHSAYKVPNSTKAYTRLVGGSGTKTVTVPKYKSLYLDIAAVLGNGSGNDIPDSAYTMTNDVANADMVNTIPTDKILLFSNWSQDLKGASGLLKDYYVGKLVQGIENNLPLENYHSEVYSKLNAFLDRYTLGEVEDPCNVIVLGDSLFARETHTSILDVVPSENPPSLVTKNIAAYMFDYLQGQKPVYSRYDKAGVFTEVGTWAEVTSFSGWDDNSDRPVHTKRTVSANASIQFASSSPYFNFIDRISSDGASVLTVAVNGGSGRVQARIEGSVNWVEANGFTFSQDKTDNGGIGSGFGDSRYQRRIEFKKINLGIGIEDILTITKDASSDAFMYWGVEVIEESKNYSRIINVARGGHKLNQLATYIEDDVYSRNPSLVILEIPLLNMIAADTTLDYSLNQLQDFVWGDRVGAINPDSLKNRSNNWTDFSVLLVVPHHSKAHFNSDSTFKKEVSNYTSEEIYKAVKGLIYSKGDVPFIDISTAFLNEIDADSNFANRYSAMGSSGKTGEGYFNDSLHQNDKGTKVYVKHLCPLFQLN